MNEIVVWVVCDCCGKWQWSRVAHLCATPTGICPVSESLNIRLSSHYNITTHHHQMFNVNNKYKNEMEIK